MNRFKLLLILLPVCYCCISQAQTFTGTVHDRDRKPVKGVSVSLLNGAGKIVSFGQTDKEGRFSISALPEKKAERISFRMMGYAPVVLNTGEFRDGQTVTLDNEGLTLKEVEVKAERIRQNGDTLTYSVNAFKQKQDRSIADVIAKMPGMEVDNDGTIKYQGKEITEFQVEGMDLMGGKYTQVSENLSADKVKSVQVMENHKKKRVLKDVSFSDQAALNIVLKDDAKNIWQGLVDVGSGVTLQEDVLWLRDVRLMGMFFGRKKQSVSMGKANNTGKNIRQEMISRLFDDNVISQESSILSNAGLGSPGLEESRHSFNNSTLAATNWLFKTRHDNDLRIQGSWFYDKTKQNAFSETVYNDIAGGYTMTEDAEARIYRSEYDGEMSYKVNKDNVWINNTLKGSIDFDRSVSLTSMNGNVTREHVKPRGSYVNEALEIMLKKGKKTYSIKTSVAYDHLPGQLLLCDSSTQRLKMDVLRWNTKADFRHRIWKLNATWSVGSQISSQRMDVENMLVNKRVGYDSECVYADPTVSYIGSTVNVSLDASLQWLSRKYETERLSMLLFQPRVTLQVKPTKRFNINANWTVNTSPNQMTEIVDIPVFVSYRSMIEGTGLMEKTRANSVFVWTDYKNVTKGFFVNTTANYSSIHDMTLYSSDVKDNFYRRYASGLKDDTESMLLSCEVSKSWRWAKTTVRVGGRVNKSNYHLLLGNRKIPYSMESASANVKLSMKPVNILSFEWMSRYTRSHQVNRNDRELSPEPLRHFYHEAKIFLLPKKWQVEWKNEFYHSNDKSIAFCHFSDLSVSYRTKEYEIGVWCNNIMGEKELKRHYDTNYQNLYSVTKLRPRELLAKIMFNI